MGNVREKRTHLYAAVEKSILSYLKEFSEQIENQDSGIDMNDIMREMVEMIEFTEQLHLNVIMSTLATALTNAREMRSIPEYNEHADKLAKSARKMFDQCRIDFNKNLDSRLKETLAALDVEAVWDTSMTHNERVAHEIMESLRGEDGADDATQSAPKEH